MIQFTVSRTGMVGRAYRQSPYPWDDLEFQVTVADIVPIECVLIDELQYTLRLQSALTRSC